MCRRFTTSLALAAGLIAAAAAQPPGTNKKPDPNADKADPAPKAKTADPADVAVSAALANDPDVKVARAKVQLAEAELAKAKQAVVLKVLTLKAGIEDHKRTVAVAQDRVAWSARMVEKGQMTQAQLLDDRAKLEGTQAALARAETELKLITGGGGGAAEVGGNVDLGDPNQSAAQLALKWLAARQKLEQHDYATRMYLAQLAFLEGHAVKGPVPDRIRTALDKPVKLGARGEKVTFAKALEVFKKDAGLDVPVRGAFPLKLAQDPRNPNEGRAGPIEVVSEGEELPVGAWFQLFEDNAVFPSAKAPTRFRVYVREYGLFIASSESAPPDAPTLTEFWKQKPAKPNPAPEPEPKPK
jgi:hypothetical protein